MGKKSRLKKERQLQQPSEMITELIEDYLAAEAKLTVDTPEVFFRGKMTTADAIFDRIFEEGEKLGFSESDIIDGWARVAKSPST